MRIEPSLRYSARPFSEWDDCWLRGQTRIPFYTNISCLSWQLFYLCKYIQVNTNFGRRIWCTWNFYLSQLPFVSTCQMLTTDLSGPGPWFFFCINPNVQDILHRADETCPNTKDYPDPKSFPISSYTCNEPEDTQTHHIFVRAQRNSIAPRWIHLSVMQTVTSTPCWSALFSSNFQTFHHISITSKH